jgi:hypothetical protein
MARTRFPGFFGNPRPRPIRTSALNDGQRIAGLPRQRSAAWLPAAFDGAIGGVLGWRKTVRIDLRR